MEKYLITGSAGFVAEYFVRYLEENRIKSNILGIDINSPLFFYNNFKYVKLYFLKLNLLEKNQVENAIYNFNPDYLLKLKTINPERKM